MIIDTPGCVWHLGVLQSGDKNLLAKNRKIVIIRYNTFIIEKG